MTEILKDKNGDTSWSTIFMGFAVALVLILQQYQTMHIAEIETQGKVDSVNFMEKDEIVGMQNKIADRLLSIENHTIPKDILNGIVDRINSRLSAVEKAIFRLNKREVALEKREEALEGNR